MLSKDNVYVAYEKLNEQCHRSLNILERHSDKGPAVAMQKTVLLPIVNRYLDGQERLAELKLKVRITQRDGHEAVGELYTAVRAWFGSLSTALEGFDPRDFYCDPTSPDTVISTADRLLELVQSQAGENSEPAIPFATQIVEDLTACKEEASSKWLQAQDCLAEQQEQRSEVRKAAAAVQSTLVSVRRTLRAILGTSHRDYQRMRLHRGAHVEADDAETIADEATDALVIEDAEPAPAPEANAEPTPAESVPIAVFGTTPPPANPESKDGGNGKSLTTPFAPTTEEVDTPASVYRAGTRTGSKRPLAPDYLKHDRFGKWYFQVPDRK